MHDPDANKANAKAFYDLMFNQSKPREAIERFVGDDYRQHNPAPARGGSRRDPALRALAGPRSHKHRSAVGSP